MTHAETTAALRARYTDPAAAAAWVNSAPTVADACIRALRGFEICAAPGGRWGLDSVSLEVRAAFADAVRKHAPAVLALHAEIRALRADGHAWDTVWHRVARDGFTFGDAGLVQQMADLFA